MDWRCSAPNRIQRPNFGRTNSMPIYSGVRKRAFLKVCHCVCVTQSSSSLGEMFITLPISARFVTTRSSSNDVMREGLVGRFLPAPSGRSWRRLPTPSFVLAVSMLLLADCASNGRPACQGDRAAAPRSITRADRKRVGTDRVSRRAYRFRRSRTHAPRLRSAPQALRRAGGTNSDRAAL